MIGKRSISALLGLVVVIAILTTVQDFRFDSRIAREHTDATAIDRDIAGITQTLSDLRAAQAGYVATGQAPGTWMTRATELFDRVNQAIEKRRVAAPNAAVRARYDAANQALAALAVIDGRARTSIGQEDRLHAADLIYIDAQSPADTFASELAAARAGEEQAAATRTRNWTMVRMAVNGLAIVLVAVIALYFGRALSILTVAPPSSMAQMIRDLPPPVKNGVRNPGALDLGAATVAPPPAPKPVVAASTVSLPAAAELCVDLARVLDGRDLPSLLERTASVLDAKGLVLWAVDTGGAMLRPSMCHGYSDKVIARLRPLQVDGDNVTSLAFRSMQAQALPGATPTDSGAIAVPLITSTGCVGVLSAEVRQSKPHPDLVPVARIVAAQFSTLVGPIDDSQRQTATS